MKEQGSRTIFYSVATSSEEDQLRKQLNDIGHTHIIKITSLGHLEELVNDAAASLLILLMADTADSQNVIPDILDLTKTLPVIGLFSQTSPHCNRRIVKACNEVTNWPCSNQELDYRMRKITACYSSQTLSCNLFVSMNILGNSPKFLQVLDRVCKIKKCDAPVFIDGETGTGKELIARAIHYMSDRRDMPFIAANCGAFPDQLLENEFFGHDKGAYTDARESSYGLIAQAEGGSLFLDELETLSPRGQIILLRFLENMMYRPLGSKEVKIANIRIITASNENISKLVEKGEFRTDLYYRINIMNIFLPPLRQRAGDINLLAEHFIRQYRIQYNQPEKELHPNTQQALKYYNWPGNVRELENILHREFLLSEGRYINIPEIVSMTSDRRHACCDRRLQKMFAQPMGKAKKHLIDDFEQQYLCSALDRANGNISKAARLAGKERRSFTRLMEKYHLDSNQYKS